MKIPKSKRARRVSAEIQKIVAEALRHESHRFPAGALVSIPEVRVSDDLSHAGLYVSVLGSEDRAAIQQQLKKLLPHLRHETARQLRIRKLPEFHLIWDETAEQADRIEQLIDRISGGEEPQDEPDGSEDDSGTE